MEQLEKELNNLKKQKIIMQSKLKQKEDKITELNRKVKELRIEAKESKGAKNLEEKIKDLEERLERSKKVNKSLRAENSRLMTELEEEKKKAKKAKSSEGKPALTPVSLHGKEEEDIEVSGPSREELAYLRSQLEKKDRQIAQLMDQLQMIDPEQLSQVGSSYMKVRKLKAKIRELKGQVELAKKSEASMRERFLKLERKMAQDDELMKW